MNHDHYEKKVVATMRRRREFLVCFKNIIEEDPEFASDLEKSFRLVPEAISTCSQARFRDIISRTFEIKPGVEEDHFLDVIALMEKRGGSFVSALATVWRRGDAVNRGRIMSIFAFTFSEYEKLLFDHRRKNSSPVESD